ncbi:mitochondrial carrier domain-containing protein [Radiomyces spectabilis]|uniref:mitochondrial carrier domain-containing protein n=1 Tax=Radiomyces spectabilis TaxID=64574 RepID=UPI00221F0180|nr:mitochondrial carrier domain-containing protein [Radiomyces spectabilis]KAI8387998.1 mitochondrial carrier domain-containing protein [Radiomyces spectabilis]
MTLTAYLGLLSLGSTTESQTGAEGEQAGQDVCHLRAMSRAVRRAEIDVVSTVAHHSTPWMAKEAKENAAGVTLAIGTMVANYTLCFPVVVARHRLQSFPHRDWRRDNPWSCAQSLWRLYKTSGFRALYPGFGLGLCGQALSAGYESLVNDMMRKIRPVRLSLRLMTLALGRLLTLAVHIPLYPLYRNALILRVQTYSVNKCITNYKTFLQFYFRDLARFIPWRKSHLHYSLPLSSTFVPSCLLNIVTERMLMHLYKYIYRHFTSDLHTESKKDKNSEVQGTSDTDEPNLGRSRRSMEEEHGMLHTFYPELACGVVSSIIVRALSYPVDTVLFRLLLQDSGVHSINTTYRGFFDCIRRTWLDEGGWRAFYPGWGAGVLELFVGYAILELSWWTYRAVDWNMRSSAGSDILTVGKARRLNERFNSSGVDQSSL